VKRKNWRSKSSHLRPAVLLSNENVICLKAVLKLPNLIFEKNSTYWSRLSIEVSVLYSGDTKQSIIILIEYVKVIRKSIIVMIPPEILEYDKFFLKYSP
jgi:hypothetical protein